MYLPEDGDEIREPVWGPWATLGFGLIVAAAFWVTQVFVLFAFLVAPMGPDSARTLQQRQDALVQSGFLLAMSICATTPICSGLILLIIRLRRNASIVGYLALRPLRLHTLFLVVMLVVAWIVLWDNVMQVLGKRVVPQFMLDAYQTAGSLPLLWLAMVLLAPLLEELFFRGFLFAGLRQSWLGDVGAILLTSLAWSTIHLQNDPVEKATIFVFGLMLGAVRARTESLWGCLAMHAMLNLAATVQTELCLRDIWVR
jgi:membrane protease YdiL (CAAX protease family)